MPLYSDLNKITVHGELSDDDGMRIIAAMHNTVERKQFSDFQLDFSGCTKAFSTQMLPIASRCQAYWKSGIDVALTLPNDDKLKRLFLNTNWAHFIDVRTYDESRYRGYTHAPAIRFSTGKEQHEAVNKVLDILLAAISHFKRADIRAIEWAINEVTDNVINHAQSIVGGLIQVSNFRQRQLIEFVVSDVGVGIPATLRVGHPEIRSDTEAVDRAIREGVTRDKSFGQGNGLYGSWRISQQSGGEFKISSGYANLNSSERHGLKINKRDIPLNGTVVSSRIGYSEKIDLSDALTFEGQTVVPVDYIETHFEEDEDGNIHFNLKEESEGFGSRAAGEPVRRKLLNVIRCLERGRAVVDCSNVPLVSSSYADELFGKLFIEIGPIEFVNTVQLVNLDPLVKNLIDKAVMQRMRQ